MWGPDNHIYFVSDRDGRMNLFSIDLASKETKQLTTFKDFDIKFPSIGKDAIVFEQAGYIWRYDLASGQAAPVPIEIKEDFASGRSALVDASKHIESVSLAPDGQRVDRRSRAAIFFPVPAKDGTAAQSHQNFERARARRRLVAGRKMDRLQLRRDRRERALCALAGRQRPAATGDQATPTPIIIKPIWSPDSKKLLWSDRLQRLRYVDVASKAVTQVDQDKNGEIESYDWSPDSQWIAWSRPEENGCRRVYLYSVADKKPTAVTDNWYSAGNADLQRRRKISVLHLQPRFQTDLR